MTGGTRFSGRFRSRNINMTVRLGQYELPLGIRNCKAVAKGDRFWMFDFTLLKASSTRTSCNKNHFMNRQ